jgi:hypothetical protein
VERYNQSQAARALGLQPHTFFKWIERGWVRGPTHQFGPRKYYTQAEVEEMRRAAENFSAAK